MTVTTWPFFFFFSPQDLSFFHFFLSFFFAVDLPISFSHDALASVNEAGANGLPTCSLSIWLVLFTEVSSFFFPPFFLGTSLLFFQLRSSRPQSVFTPTSSTLPSPAPGAGGSQSTLVISVSYGVDGLSSAFVLEETSMFTRTHRSPRIFQVYARTYTMVRGWRCRQIWTYIQIDECTHTWG